MLIPSVDEWPRLEFCSARARQMAAQKQLDAKAGLQDKVHYAETKFDEIICDYCAAEITDLTILLVDFGRRVACKECFNKSYRNEPLSYRRLKTDGSLGEVEC